MNPFIHRDRITQPEFFAGRWREISQIFERLERRRPIVIVGAPKVGKSSILTHVAQSAGAVLELPNLLALFVDLAVLPDAATAYRLILRSLGAVGETHQLLAEVIKRTKRPLLICLDGLDAAIEVGWGVDLVERLARLARTATPTYAGGIVPPDAGLHDLMLVTVAGREAPFLSEPLAVVSVGALSASEVRLLIEAYLEGSQVQFSNEDVRELTHLSAGHPAYLQRAAFHRFRAYQEPGYNWRAAYRDEVREQPIIGAPLPPDTFQDADDDQLIEEAIDESGPKQRRRRPAGGAQGTPGQLLEALGPPVLALLVFQLTASWPAALLVLVLGYLLVSRLT